MVNSRTVSPSDFLGTLYLATKAPVVVAPAMNVNMWEHPATQENFATLRARGVHVVDPGEGYLACGMTGAGRLAATEAIVEKVRDVLGLRRDLEGRTVLVTAGPTREDIDPVRFLTNRSSGKMGYALADAAIRRGARVILVSGPADITVPGGVDWVPVRTSDEMHRAVRERPPKPTSSSWPRPSPITARPHRHAEAEARRRLAHAAARAHARHSRRARPRKRFRSRILVGFAAETDASPKTPEPSSRAKART